MVTNIVILDAQVSIEHEARKWLIRMDADDPLNDTERESLKEWMGRSVLHRSELVRLGKFWSQANILTELIAGLEPDRAQRRTHGWTSWVRAILMSTSAVFAAVILVYLSFQASIETNTLTYRTDVGQQRTVVMSDGSSIQLNTDSQVQVAYRSNSRRIRLLRGEALFSVTPDTQRVFEVHVANSIVRAIGTAFAIHIEGRKVEVTVTEGVVDVSDLRAAQTTEDRTWTNATPPTSNLGLLRAGEVGSFDSGSGHMEVRQLAKPELQCRMAWQDGFLVFSGEPLRDVVAQLNRYSMTTLEIGDPKLGSLEIGGRFRIGDLDGVLDLLNTAFGIRSRQVNEHKVRLESKPAD